MKYILSFDRNFWKINFKVFLDNRKFGIVIGFNI